MKSKIITLLTILTSGLFSSTAMADRYCVQNADKLQLFYVNGMFKKLSGFTTDLAAINEFQENHLYMFEKAGNAEGVHNYDEIVANQLFELVQHKTKDMEVNDPIRLLLISFVAGELNKASRGMLEQMNNILSVINFENIMGIIHETNYRNMRTRLFSVLARCNRTILLTHGQGNFYGNTLYSDIFDSYQYYYGPELSEFPMLGYMGLSNPSHEIGGPAGANNPSIAKTFTNEDDLFTNAFRFSFGGVPSNPVSGSSMRDFSGHTLRYSYLESPAVRDILASMFEDITKGITPFPMYDQHPSSSSAIKSIGYSKINNILDVEFEHGGAYRYFDVPVGTWEHLYRSTSHGTYFNENIRGNFSYEKLEPLP
ncbi:KTSC domain-containing protein [Vibrio sp. FJH11]